MDFFRDYRNPFLFYMILLEEYSILMQKILNLHGCSSNSVLEKVAR